ncbi:unnamed protein product [marine sediment metagenome]|uniref:Uncharacterized protein n=1 Tax=marine sediment metagenome TaxID=412755 RepID=X1F454_9ZZZZ
MKKKKRSRSTVCSGCRKRKDISEGDVWLLSWYCYDCMNKMHTNIKGWQ